MDNLAVLSLLALLPLLSIGVLLVGFRWPAKRAMPVGYVIVVAIAVLVWNIEWVNIAAATSPSRTIQCRSKNQSLGIRCSTVSRQPPDPTKRPS